MRVPGAHPSLQTRTSAARGVLRGERCGTGTDRARGVRLERRDLARDFRALGDLDLLVADLAADAGRRVDDQLLARGQLAAEPAMDLGYVYRYHAVELALLGDLQHARVERGFEAAFDDERVAVDDLGA